MKKLVKFLFFNLLSLVGRPLGKIFRKKFPKSVSSILVFTGTHIGDIIELIPAIRALQSLFPQAKLAILSGRGREFFKYFPESKKISCYIFYDIQKKHNSLFKKLLLIKKLRKLKFELIFVPTRGVGICEDSLMAALIGAPYRVGFEYKGYGFLNNIKKTFKRDIPILKQNLSLLDVKNFDEKVEILLSEEDEKFASILIKETQKIISIHPGADWQADFKIWPRENFKELIKLLLDKYPDIKVAILGSTNEKSFSLFISDIKSSRVIDLVGKTTIGQMMAIVKYSYIFIGNDSGPLHVARAFKVPTVGIFGPTDPKQIISDWENFIPVYKQLPCWPCYYHQPFFKPKCKSPPLCLKKISVSEVIKAVDMLIWDLKDQPVN